MLNQISERESRDASQWCVGEPPMPWDVPFGARLAAKLRQLFWRDAGDRAISISQQKRAAEERVLREAA
jgi:hypothetical protein